MTDVTDIQITVGCRLCAYPRIHLLTTLKISQDHGRLSIVRIFEHSLFRLKITVGCRLCAYPSIHLLTTLNLSRSRSVARRAHIQAFTFSSQDHGRLSNVYISKHSCKNVQTCWTPWSTQETRGLWARPPVLTPVPVQAIHSRACLNLHHCDIQSTAQKSPCVNTFF